MRTRDRHGRGLRGPLALPNPLTRAPAPVRGPLTGAAFFQDCLQSSIERIGATCPDALLGVEIGMEDVPSRAAIWHEFVAHDAVPLAAAIDAQPDRPARVVVYRRPIERRSPDRAALEDLVHHALVEQLSVLTSRSVRDIDPNFDEDW
ncbi:MAG: metallopeptidase family protein [Actinomycetia bacterium]|nr:metallopeptidase family protein [Actinomycetes bacterium]